MNSPRISRESRVESREPEAPTPERGCVAETSRSKPPRPTALLFALALVLTFGLLAPAVQAQNPVGSPTCKTTVTPTNNWVATSLGARVYSITAYNASASDQYLFIVDTNSVAGAGNRPYLPPILIPAGKTGWWDWSDVGFTFSAGVVICSSSTAATLTIGTADLTIAINYHGKN